MSKMPAKKKSCFQITSVTQAQVAQASSITDDTESLDDPDDQSRTEDVSSEIFDVSRADLMGVCDRSSSEETLNNVGEHQEGHQPASTGPVNGGFSVRSAGSGHVTPHLAGGVPVPTASQPSIPSSTTTTQPIVNSVPHHANVPTTVAQVNPVATSTTTTTTTCSSRFRVIKLDHGTGEPFRRGRWTCTEFYERDSEGSSMSRTVDSIKHVVVLDHNVDRDSGLGVTGGSVIIPSAGSAQESNADSGYSIAYHTHPPEPLQHGYTLVSQTGNGASAFQPTGYSTAVPQHPQQANMQPVVPQNLHPSGLNGAAHGAMLQKSPIMPPAQQYAYSTHGGGQLDYRQQQFAPLQPQGSNTQNHLPMASLSVGPPASQGPSPAISPAGPGAQGLGMVAQGGEASAASATATYNSVQNVPATVPSSNNIPPGMLNHTLSAGGLVQAQGAYGGALMMGLPVGFSMQAEDGGRKFDILPQPSAGALAVKDGMKPFISESGGLPTPTTVSIFGIPITIDGDEDRNPSTAFYQAFPPSRLRGSKPINDSTSGASVVAIDNKIEQAMDLVKSHLMYAVREEVEVLKEQIKELYERNSMLERENAVLKSLANTEQLSQVSNQVSPAGSMSPPQQQILHHHPSAAAVNHNNNNSPNASLAQHDGGQTTAPPHQPNVTSA